MKKIIYIFSLFITVIGLLGSCINLESESYDSINTTIFPTNADDADALVIAAAYGPFRADGYSGLFQCAKGGLGVIRCMIIFKFINALGGTFYKQAATGKPYILIYFKAEICA